MKHTWTLALIAAATAFFMSPATYAQEAPATEEAHQQDALALYKGDWVGELKQFGLTLIVHIDGDTAEEATITLDSPDQSAFGLPGEVDAMSAEALKASFASISAKLSVSPDGEGLAGMFSQGGANLDLVLARLDPDDESNKPSARPQEDALVRDYKIETVSIPGGADGVTLAGELTLPKTGAPSALLVLISGSGPQDRNEELFRHKPFLILSDHLTNKGFGVLRYDDRGFGESTGDFSTATTKDFADDAAAAMRYLKGLPGMADVPVGLIGHSEGGLIAPLAAKELRPDLMVLLAGPGEKLSDVILRQSEDIAKAGGANPVALILQKAQQTAHFDLLRSAPPETLEADMIALIKTQGAPEEAARSAATQLTSPWMLWAFDYDPVPALVAYDGPVLALFGETDLQVAAEPNADIMQSALSHSASKVETLNDLNHLFQVAETGTLDEYAKIETSFDEGAMDTISTWIDTVLDQ